jgi:hypothetical protein
MTRPFKVLGIQQIAIGAPSKDRLRTLWVDMLGLEVTGNFVSERENVDEDICAIGRPDAAARHGQKARRSHHAAQPRGLVD